MGGETGSAAAGRSARHALLLPAAETPPLPLLLALVGLSRAAPLPGARGGGTAAGSAADAEEGGAGGAAGG